MRGRLTILAALAAVLLFSCATYTVGEGKAAIDIPERVTEPETRFRVITERRQAERLLEEENARRMAEAEEKARQEELARQAAEEEARRAAEELYRLTAVYEYPDDLSLLVIPHNYRPRREHLTVDTSSRALRLLFVPLEDGADLGQVESSIRALEWDFLFVTGSLEQQVEFSKDMGYDTVVLEGGSVLYHTSVKEMDEDSVVFNVDDGKDIEIAVADAENRMPADASSVASWVAGLEGDVDMLAGISLKEPKVIFAFSSSEPASSDWSILTPMGYRTDHTFSNSSFFLQEGYWDLYRDTRFTSETDMGNTRTNGEVSERMDFIYIRNLLPSFARTFSVAGMDNRCIYGEVFVP